MRDGCLVQNVIDACLLRGTLWYVLYVCDTADTNYRKNSLLSMLTRNNTVDLLDWIVRMCAKILCTYTNLNLPLEALV